MNDLAVAGWAFMGTAWAIVLLGAGLCVRRIVSVKKESVSANRTDAD